MAVTAVVRDVDSEEFFDATGRGELLIRECRSCGHFLRPDRTLCPKCGSVDLAWRPASGRATLVSWGVVHERPARPEDPVETTVLGLVELEEGPWMHAALVGVDPAGGEGPVPVIGSALRVDFVRPAGSEAVPVFRPA